ncbi:MAG: hypothetical protein KGH52_00790 [Candidatus Micrarchaeota archaeon]|nr:hypothetical protein [Candidatus Micrarchaeota archaeon]
MDISLKSVNSTAFKTIVKSEPAPTFLSVEQPKRLSEIFADSPLHRNHLDFRGKTSKTHKIKNDHINVDLVAEALIWRTELIKHWNQHPTSPDVDTVASKPTAKRLTPREIGIVPGSMIQIPPEMEVIKQLKHGDYSLEETYSEAEQSLITLIGTSQPKTLNSLQRIRELASNANVGKFCLEKVEEMAMRAANWTAAKVFHNERIKRIQGQ